MTITNLVKLIKQDIGLRDLPSAITDTDLVERLQLSSLYDFSVLYPYEIKFTLGATSKISMDSEIRGTYYKIPKEVIGDATLLYVHDINSYRPNSQMDWGIQDGWYMQPDAILDVMSSMALASTMSTAMNRQPTFHFKEPDILIVYSNWYSQTFEVTAGVTHDINLTTIPGTAIPDYRKLATLDIKNFIYKQLYRKDGIETGLGSIDLKISDWSNAEAEYAELLAKWSEDYNLNFARIQYI